MSEDSRDTLDARQYTGESGRSGERSKEDALARGTAIGRYVVLERVGAGGMGVVYAAFDPELDRRVAIKLLVDDAPGGEEADARQRRLLREARAMAKLAHPNDNVLVDQSEEVQRARVTDFGLARAPAAGEGPVDLDALSSAETAPAPALGSPGVAARPDSGGSGSGGGLDSVTRPGVLLGTPEYMAPEQYRGESTDARTDQFSFCVALFEALYRERPFPGDSPRALASAVLAGKLRTPKKSGRVPSHVREVLTRGLSIDPERRFPSMAALLDALERDPAARRRRIAAIVVGAVAIGAVALLARNARQRSQLCTGADAALAGVWDDAQRARIQGAFAASGTPFADDAWRNVHASLDAYTARWVAARTDACVSARVRGVQSDQVFTLRTRCLDERMGQVRALTDLLATADKDVTEHAVQAVSALPLVDACNDTAALTARVPPPPDPGTVQKVDEVREKMARARALGEAGRAKEALVLAKELSATATDLKYRPLEADALLLRGDLEYEAGDLKAAHETLRRAAFAAEAGRADDVSAEIWATLVGLSGGMLYDKEDAARNEERARAALERSGKGGLAELLLLEGLQRTYHAQKRYAEAETTGRAALALAKKLYGDEHPRVAHVLMRLGAEVRDQRRLDEAIAILKDSVALHEKLFGAFHPAVAEAVNALGIAQAYAASYGEALQSYRRALAIREKSLGPDHPAVAIALVNVALAMRRQGESADGIAVIDRAIAIEERSLGADHPETADAIVDRGLLLEQLGRFDDARADFARARVTYEKKLGAAHAEVARVVRSDGHVLLAAGKAKDALLAYEAARAIDKVAPGPESAEYAADLTGSARAQIALGHASLATPLLEEALAIGEKKRLTPDLRGEARFALATALGSGDRAIDLARKAEEDFRAGPWLRADHERVTAWLARADKP
jgi:tetratricopeptide (TPR) repeat protein